MADTPNDLLKGTLNLLVLRALRDESRHGWGIQQRINQLAEDTLAINQGSLYPALIRLEKKGLIQAEWGKSDAGRQAKFYSLTKKGHKQMDTDIELWRRFSLAINFILEEA